MKKIITFLLCSTAVFYSIFILIGSKFHSIGEKFLVQYESENFSFGDLYSMSELKEFKQKISRVPTTQTTTIETAEIIFLGDSFSTTDFESTTIPSQLADALKKPIFHEQELTADPIPYLKKINFKKGKPKILILETAERAVIDRALKYGATNTQTANYKVINNGENFSYGIFESIRVDYFFKHNILINAIRLYIKQLNFKLFKRIDSRIGSYSLNPPMLFYLDEVAFGKMKNVPMTKIADSIKNLNETLKNEYNLTLIYLVIPNKYTIYNDWVNDGSYNGFLIGLQDELTNRWVLSPDIFRAYIDYRNISDELLYYPNDTHFTPVGKKIVVKKLLEAINIAQQNFPSK